MSGRTLSHLSFPICEREPQEDPRRCVIHRLSHSNNEFPLDLLIDTLSTALLSASAEPTTTNEVAMKHAKGE